MGSGMMVFRRESIEVRVISDRGRALLSSESGNRPKLSRDFWKSA
jgi:hypothetical protein